MDNDTGRQTGMVDLPPEVFERLKRGLQRLKRGLQEEHERQTPNPDGTCKTLGCGGRVVRKVSGYLFRPGGFTYGIAECEKCGRKYMSARAEDIPTTGEKELLASLEQPDTI